LRGIEGDLKKVSHVWCKEADSKTHASRRSPSCR